MNVEDASVAWAERDASPTRMRSYDTTVCLRDTIKHDAILCDNIKLDQKFETLANHPL